ncbi:hypothetical protein DSO57_1027491 [Entomophthora muscae]|uniref:Uncharacterized protein n=1 Tax=Entomophthora muscae TaxID=34485 RepID=A0ACC2SRH4_9FUNG|nr:hypothetical protein DSO57_1027491 [Entomophthora muscae]
MTKGKKQPKKEQLDIDDHQLTLDQLCERYGTKANPLKPDTSDGLTPEQISNGQETYGPNMLSPPVKKSPFIRFLECLTGLFNLLLMIAGALNLILFFIDMSANVSALYLGVILLGVTVLNRLDRIRSATKER